jgi:hypothetical protein
VPPTSPRPRTTPDDRRRSPTPGGAAHVLGFQLIDFLTHAPDDAARDENEPLDLLAARRAIPRVGARSALDDVAAAVQ